MADSDALAALFGGVNNSRGPAELSDFERTIAQNDLWKIAAAPILGAKFDSSTWNPTTKLGVSALQSFLGTALGEYGKKQEAIQMEKVAEVLPQLYSDPSSVALPEGVDKEAFNGLKLAAMAKRANTDANVREYLGQNFIDVNPDGSLKAKANANSALSEIFKAKNPGLSDPNNPDSAAYKDRGRVMKEEDDRRKEIASTKSGASLASIVGVLPVLDKFAKDNTKTSDIPFVYKFVQAQDGGVVKEGEQQMVAGASPLIARYSAALNGALNGTSTLTPEIKQQMVNEMKLAGRELYQGHKQEAEPLFQLGESRGGNRKGMNPFNESYLDSLLQVQGSDSSELLKKGADTINENELKDALKGLLAKKTSGQAFSPEDLALLEIANKKVTRK